MTGVDLLTDAFGRINQIVRRVADDLNPEELSFRIDGTANSIAWLLWHLTRVQDDHIAEVAETDQVWISDGWADRFALPFEPTSTGYGHSSRDVAAVRVGSADLLTRYHDAVHERTTTYLGGLTDSDFDRIVDDSYDPPVTLGVRLVSVISDGLQHAGQAAFVSGIVERG